MALIHVTLKMYLEVETGAEEIDDLNLLREINKNISTSDLISENGAIKSGNAEILWLSQKGRMKIFKK